MNVQHGFQIVRQLVQGQETRIGERDVIDVAE